MVCRTRNLIRGVVLVGTSGANSRAGVPGGLLELRLSRALWAGCLTLVEARVGACAAGEGDRLRLRRLDLGSKLETLRGAGAGFDEALLAEVGLREPFGAERGGVAWLA